VTWEGSGEGEGARGDEQDEGKDEEGLVEEGD